MTDVSPITPTQRRKRMIVQRRFQMKYAGWVMALCLLVGWLAAAIVYITAMNHLGAKIEQIYPQARAVEIFQNAQIKLMLNLLWLLPVLLVVSVWMSHKIAGPLVRIRRLVDEIGHGDVPGPIKLRKHDELQDLADALNLMTARLRAQFGTRQEFVRELQETAAALSRALSGVEVNREEAGRLLDRLNHQLSRMNGTSPNDM